MAMIEVTFGKSKWPLTFGTLLPSPVEAIEAISDPRAAVVKALEKPIRFEAFHRAITPDDRIALVVDESLPHLGDLIAGVLEYLAQAGISPGSVTAISPPDSTQAWINDLPEAMADLQTETHQPKDRTKLSYLSATKEGQRIYLNRTVVDADQTLVLCGRRYDPLLGHAGAAGSIYPLLADADTTRSLVTSIAPQLEPEVERPSQKQAEEVGWLLGSPFFLQVIEGFEDQIHGVIAGMADTAADGIALYDAVWKRSIPEQVDVAVVTLTGDPARHDFADLARAAACGARAVKEDGNIVILSEADLDLGGALEALRRSDDPQEAVALMLRERPADAAPAIQWCWAAEHAKIYLASEIRPRLVEEIFATPLSGPKDVQRLLDAATSSIIIIDGHKSWITTTTS